MAVIVKKSIEIPGLGQKIRLAQRASTYSVKELASIVGIGQAHWHMIIAEKKSLAYEHLRKIEEVLEVDFGVEI